MKYALVYCCSTLLLSSSIFLLLVCSVKKEKEEVEKKNMELMITITRLKADSAWLDSQLKEKDMHIVLDVNGIKPYKGGGITVNTIQNQ